MMDWIQLVLPTEGMQRALIQYVQAFEEQGQCCMHLCREQLENDYYEWLEKLQDRMLGLDGAQEILYLAVDMDDQVVGSLLLCAEEEQAPSVLVRPDRQDRNYPQQMLQQLQDLMGKKES